MEKIKAKWYQVDIWTNEDGYNEYCKVTDVEGRSYTKSGARQLIVDKAKEREATELYWIEKDGSTRAYVYWVEFEDGELLTNNLHAYETESEKWKKKASETTDLGISNIMKHIK